MIISASRRTDIPAFYSDWFMGRLKEGYALVPNPRNPGRIGRVAISPQNVDCIVFWTKNPLPMLGRFGALDNMGYAHYTQFTLTPYGTDIEPLLPPKSSLLQAFTDMAALVGKQRCVWRYDPIFIDDKRSVAWHLAMFSKMCKKLENCTERCVLSFIDPYRHIGKSFRAMTTDEIHAIASGFSEIAAKHGIALFTCSEEIDLSDYEIGHSACIDQTLIEKIIGCSIKAKTDANQRAACCCVESVDLGAYDTCPHGCTYCYATFSRKTVLRRVQAHDPAAPMITGWPNGSEIITDRTTTSQKIAQISLLDQGVLTLP